MQSGAKNLQASVVISAEHGRGVEGSLLCLWLKANTAININYTQLATVIYLIGRDVTCNGDSHLVLQSIAYFRS